MEWEPKPAREWIVNILVYVAGIAVLLGLIYSISRWPMFHILGD